MSTAVRPSRVAFIDVLRLFALAQMVNGHTLDAIMSADLRTGAFFHWYSWARGLVSVAFLMASGLAFYVATLMRFEKHKADPRAVRKRLWRGVMLIAVGYGLRLPVAALFGDAAASEHAMQIFLRVEVLQCIGVCLLIMEGLVIACSSARQVVIACAVLAPIAILLGPFGDALSATGRFTALTDWVGHHGGSFFPLTPWAGFILGGVALGAVFFPSGVETAPRTTILRVLATFAVAVVLWRLAVASPFTMRDATTTHHSRPELVMQKLALCMGMILLLALATQRITRLPKVLQILASETLAIYVFHLVVLFVGGIGVANLFPRTLPLPLAFCVSAAMMIASVFFALWWHRYKKWRDAGGWSSAMQRLRADRG